MAKERTSLGAELRAMAREGIKDVRGMVHETYFGKPEHAPEMGAPLSPTSQMVTEDLTHGQDAHLEQYQPAKDEPAQQPEMDLDRD